MEFCSARVGQPLTGGAMVRGSLRNLALGTWNGTSLLGKEPELMLEVEKYELGVVALTSTHSFCSGV